MTSSRLWVHTFRSAAQERAFRVAYARRFFGQRRLAISIFTALWVVFSLHDLGRLDVLDPAHLHHLELVFLRIAGTVGMAAPVLLWALSHSTSAGLSGCSVSGRPAAGSRS
jgi:hypothetical protein